MHPEANPGLQGERTHGEKIGIDRDQDGHPDPLGTLNSRLSTDRKAVGEGEETSGTWPLHALGEEELPVLNSIREQLHDVGQMRNVCRFEQINVRDPGGGWEIAEQSEKPNAIRSASGTANQHPAFDLSPLP